MKYLILIPSIYKPFTEACIASMNTELQRNVLVVDNTVNNKGVAASWNVGAKKVIEDKLDWLVILSASMRFHDTQGDDLFDALCWTKYSIVQSELVHSWHLIALRREVIEQVGLFDEKFYPAYYEDCDYSRRINLFYKDQTGNKWGRENIIVCNVGSGHGDLLGKADVKAHMPKLQEYYISKWGGLPGSEIYNTPFNK